MKPDTRIQLLKEDGLNRYRSQDINQLDMLQALDFMGVRIRKFDLGTFDQKYQLHIYAETYRNGEVVKTDTMFAYDKEYHYYEQDEKGTEELLEYSPAYVLFSYVVTPIAEQ